MNKNEEIKLQLSCNVALFSSINDTFANRKLCRISQGPSLALLSL
ncbi:hypothetical protein T11_17368 [Trichinella zimbabwensis]|uniref:Uncharacterized protein n=1 Tax=Trichinella zimbabwensis TaxID=268475 RepID=A0A0V1GD30_9BILA|nr:hypothetical protein T11_17368 [Trichinella zimbabwensis]